MNQPQCTRNSCRASQFLSWKQVNVFLVDARPEMFEEAGVDIQARTDGLPARLFRVNASKVADTSLTRTLGWLSTYRLQNSQ